MACPIKWLPTDPEKNPPTGDAKKHLDEITSGLDPKALTLDDLKEADRELQLAKNVFDKNFMPYAKKTWQYGSDPSKANAFNCSDLAEAFVLTWFWIRHLRQKLSLKTDLKASRVTIAGPLITSSRFSIFAPASQGNVWNTKNPPTLSGQCYFALHDVCGIGTYGAVVSGAASFAAVAYFDPTLNRYTDALNDCIERRVEKILDKQNKPVLLSMDGKYIYTRRPEACGPFADSWYEIGTDEAKLGKGHVKRLPKKDYQLSSDAWDKIKKKLKIS